MKKNHSNSIPIYIHTPEGDRWVGSVIGDEFVKRLHCKEHMKHTPPGWAFDESSLKDAAAFGARWVHIFDLDTGKEYFAQIGEIARKGRYFNEGHNDQIELTLEHWSNSRTNQEEFSI